LRKSNFSEEFSEYIKGYIKQKRYCKTNSESQLW